ncbi:hypothetical protein [Actinoplanes xinjiangensis]|uniref:hypothetical protein n=1 Tax=Actinoplanes xinjiangensis TaxID=512350 RepID=UPI003420A34A
MARRVLTAAVTIAALAASAGCIGMSEPVDDYLIGLARIGDTYRIFVPLCPGQKVVGLEVTDDDTVRPSGVRPHREIWWRAGGPRDVDGPGEFLGLGVDAPFTDVPVPAGGNPARPRMPEDFIVNVDLVDMTGGTRREGFLFTTAEAAVHPAGADPRTIGYVTSADPQSPDEIRNDSGCPLGDERSPDAGVPGRQSSSSIRSGAAERVERALLGADAVPGRRAVEIAAPWTEDIASDACGNSAAKGAYTSAFGQQRRWMAGRRFVVQFAGAFGTVTAADAVAQADGALECTSYEDLADYSEVRRVPLPPLPSVDRQLMYCERVDQAGDRFHSCTVLLARGDVLTRLEVQDYDAAELPRLVADLVPRAAAALQTAVATR